MDEELENYPGISPKPVYGVFGACGYLPNSILLRTQRNVCNQKHIIKCGISYYAKHLRSKTI